MSDELTRLREMLKQADDTLYYLVDKNLVSEIEDIDLWEVAGESARHDKRQVIEREDILFAIKHTVAEVKANPAKRRYTFHGGN